ncbi:MAG: dinitrogenase iron-molybdenum cofactor biosynthesis protein [Thermoproteus sp.]|nr:dinitrogenase iron-molybdenum cofactor biosynthesis protein [Thermoproteus sp.]
MRVAIASTKDGLVFPGHFAHAEAYAIYELEPERGLRRIEERANPLGSAPDLDAGGQRDVPAHGLPKYQWLRRNVLHDVDVVIAAGACQTSYAYFTSEGVKLLFTDPIEVKTIEKYISDNINKFIEEINK